MIIYQNNNNRLLNENASRPNQTPPQSPITIVYVPKRSDCTGKMEFPVLNIMIASKLLSRKPSNIESRRQCHLRRRFTTNKIIRNYQTSRCTLEQNNQSQTNLLNVIIVLFVPVGMIVGAHVGAPSSSHQEKISDG